MSSPYDAVSAPVAAPSPYDSVSAPVGDQPQENTLSDVVKSAGTGLVKGATALIGLPGDLKALLDAGANKVRQFIDSTAQPVSTANTSPIAAPTTAKVDNAVQSVVGPYHQPQTTAGKYAQTIASFAPAAIGPGGVIAKAARVIIPGAASEAAGEATQGTPLEPYARVVGALAGGAATGIGDAMLTANRATPGIPSIQDLRQAAQQSYTDADNAGLIVKGSSFKDFADNLGQQLVEEGLDQTLHPKATAVYRNIAGNDGNITLKGIDILRQQAGDAAGSFDPAERRLGYIIKDNIDDYVGGLKPQDVVQGDAQGASDAINRARSLWSTSSKAQIIQNAIDKAGANNGLYTVAGDENALRIQFRKLANNDRVMARFAPDEQDAIRQVAQGTPIGNALRFIGKFSPHGVISAAPTFGAYEAGGPVAAGAVAAGTELARQGARASTMSNARYASELVRSSLPPSISQAALGKLPVAPAAAALNSSMVIPYTAALTAAAGANSP